MENKRNAIILAAGMSTRFAPLSYECPKGLLNVRGEILIERQIRQLQEAGISNIIVIVGYMKESFMYLKDKFGVDIVVNDDYNRYNNTSSLIRVLDKLGDTYLCSSDNYFPKNVFADNPTQSYYSALYHEGETNEYCLTTNLSGDIVKVEVGGKDSWYMIGHAYFSNEFSEKFKWILEKEYAREEARYGYWEDVYLRNIDRLPKMKINRYQSHDIEEFDSLEELRLFDEKYINDTGCSIFRNICDVLSCEEKDIVDISVLKAGMTNNSFVFTCLKDRRRYVYRHPGKGTDAFISRKSEAFSMSIAKLLNIDQTFIYMDEDKGWKLAFYIEDAHQLDYHNKCERLQALGLIRKLHNANIQSEFTYRLWDQALDFLHKIQQLGKDDSSDFYRLYEMIERLHNYTQSDGWSECLNHCDPLAANFLFDANGNLSLIDWEYSGQGDVAQDLGSFIACSDLSYAEVLLAVEEYLEHYPSSEELRHYLAYVAIASYCWYLWAIYQEANGVDTGGFLKLWYDYSYFYYNKAIELYRN